MGMWSPSEGKGYTACPHCGSFLLSEVVYKGRCINKDECTPGEWKKILADKEQDEKPFLARLFGI